MQSWSARTVVSFGLLGSAACADVAEAELCSKRQQLFGASVSAEELGVSAVVPALARIEFSGRIDGEDASILCTATRIAADRMLTAAHCVPEAEARTLRLMAAASSPDDASCGSQPTLKIQNLSVRRHPDLDVLLFSGLGLDGVTLPLSRTAPREGDEGFIAGFGLQETGVLGELEFLPASVRGRREAELEVVAGPDRGACIGDSGGPLFQRNDEGFALVGVLSTGSSNCREYDHFIAIEAFLDWVDTPSGKET